MKDASEVFGTAMDTDSAERLLDIFIDNSRRILAAYFGLNAVESTFFDVIALLRQHPSLKDTFLRRAARSFELVEPGSLEHGVVPMELIELVVHEFDWPELQEMAVSRVSAKFRNDWRLAASDLSDHVRRARARDWPDREFYRHYSSQK